MTTDTESYKFSTEEHIINLEGKEIECEFANALLWQWIAYRDIATSDSIGDRVYFSWLFQWNEMRHRQIGGFQGTITVDFSQNVFSGKKLHPPLTFDILVTRSGQYVEKCIGTRFDLEEILKKPCKCTFDLTPILKNTGIPIFEQNFQNSPKTDAILVVEDQKLHVNTAFLSFHSEFFDKLFNSDFREKSIAEIPIGDVKYEEFATFLCAFYPKPILPTVETAASLLQLADRFMVPYIIRLVEAFLISCKKTRLSEKILLADKHSLEKLMDWCLDELCSPEDVKRISTTCHYEPLSDAAKIKLSHRALSFY